MLPGRAHREIHTNEYTRVVRKLFITTIMLAKISKYLSKDFLICFSVLTVSSLPSKQSLSPSQTHSKLMQLPSGQVNASGGQGAFGPQFFSSLASPQSLSPSQTQRFWMQRELAQVNSSVRQVVSKYNTCVRSKSVRQFC